MSVIPRISDINWSDDKIFRAGVIPIYKEKFNTWIGLAISSFSTNLGIIGGGFESTDFDFLDTAVREFKEEIGDNIPTPDITRNNYYVISDDSFEGVYILYPIKSKPDKFNPTEEISDLLWVTPNQLKIIDSNKDMLLPNSRSRAFSLSGSIRKILSKVADVVSSGIPFDVKPLWSPLERNKKLLSEATFQLITDPDGYLENINDGYIWGVSTFMTIGYDNVGFINKEKKLFYLPRSLLPEIIKNLNYNNKIIYVSTKADAQIINNLSENKRLLHSIERDTDYENKEYFDLWEEFAKKLNDIRINDNEEERIINECDLLVEYEEKLYFVKERLKTFANKDRTCFFKYLNMVNNLLSTKKFMYLNQLQRETYKKCGNYRNDYALNFMIYIGLLQNHNNKISLI